MTKELVKEVRKIRLLLEKNLIENRKQTKWILAWKNMDEDYHKTTLKKLGGNNHGKEKKRKAKKEKKKEVKAGVFNPTF